MQAFESLSQTGQVRRLKQLAESVLREYDLPAPRIARLLLHVENTTFEVHDSAGGKYCLRVGSGLYQPPDAVAIEADWLANLRTDLGDIAPCPVLSRQGRRVVTCQLESVPRARPCLLLDWLPGRSFFGHRSEDTLRTAGRLLGLLHRHGRSFEPERHRLRARWDETSQLAEARLLEPIRTSPAVTPAVRLVLERATPVVLRLIRRMPRTKHAYGWIHADPHPGNLLIEGRRVRAIDFDDCGRGYYAWDLASLIGRKPEPGRQEAVLAGYEEVRALPDDVAEQIAVFHAARALSLASWVAERTDNPALRSQAGDLLERWASWLDRHVRGGRCL